MHNDLALQHDSSSSSSSSNPTNHVHPTTTTHLLLEPLLDSTPNFQPIPPNLHTNAEFRTMELANGLQYTLASLQFLAGIFPFVLYALSIRYCRPLDLHYVFGLMIVVLDLLISGFICVQIAIPSVEGLARALQVVWTVPTWIMLGFLYQVLVTKVGGFPYRKVLVVGFWVASAMAVGFRVAHLVVINLRGREEEEEEKEEGEEEGEGEGEERPRTMETDDLVMKEHGANLQLVAFLMLATAHIMVMTMFLVFLYTTSSGLKNLPKEERRKRQNEARNRALGETRRHASTSQSLFTLRERAELVKHSIPCPPAKPSRCQTPLTTPTTTTTLTTTTGTTTSTTQRAQALRRRIAIRFFVVSLASFINLILLPLLDFSGSIFIGNVSYFIGMTLFFAILGTVEVVNVQESAWGRRAVKRVRQKLVRAKTTLHDLHENWKRRKKCSSMRMWKKRDKTRGRTVSVSTSSTGTAEWERPMSMSLYVDSAILRASPSPPPLSAPHDHHHHHHNHNHNPATSIQNPSSPPLHEHVLPRTTPTNPTHSSHSPPLPAPSPPRPATTTHSLTHHHHHHHHPSPQPRSSCITLTLHLDNDSDNNDNNVGSTGAGAGNAEIYPADDHCRGSSGTLARDVG